MEIIEFISGREETQFNCLTLSQQRGQLPRHHKWYCWRVAEFCSLGPLMVLAMLHVTELFENGKKKQDSRVRIGCSSKKLFLIYKLLFLLQFEVHTLAWSTLFRQIRI